MNLDVIRLGWPISNVWLLPETPMGPVLIDSGFHARYSALEKGLERAGCPADRLHAVILTHRHSDHAGNARRLQQRYGTNVFAHRLDAEILTGAAPRPKLPLAHVAAGLAAVENRFPSRVERVVPLEDGLEIAGLRVLWTPGHTIGSLMLYHPPSRSLFSGDALLNAVPPTTVRTALALPYAGFCDDYAQALTSAESILTLGLRVETLYAGHGPPRPGPIDDELHALLQPSARDSAQL